MTWHFRPLAIGEKTREPIQGEFFSTEAIHNPTEALVREGIQNSLDAGTELPVRVRLFLASGQNAAPASRVTPWLKGAWEHIQANGNGLREPPSESDVCPFLVFEDFGTRGLQGDVSQAFDEPGIKNHFFYFFRAEGRSGKSELDRGRWGIGKHVFPRSSRISTFFGLTIRADDEKQLLMGHTVLKSHRAAASATPFSPDGYFGQRQPNNLVLPISEKATIEKFSADFNLKRDKNLGLSIVVPFVDPDFTANHLKEAVVCGYFYPILTGALVVTVETPTTSTVIDAETLVDVALGLDGETGKELLQLVDLAQWGADCKPQNIIKLSPCNPDKPSWNDDLIPAEEVKSLRKKLDAGEKLAVRATLTVREKGQGRQAKQTHFDFFLWQDGFESGKTVFIREGIIISDVRALRTRGVRSLVVIEDKPIATLLGDAENPAHTQWQTDSSNFKNKYIHGPAYLTFVKEIVYSFVHALRAQEEEEDPNLLLEIFSLPAPKDEEPPSRPEERKKKKKGEETEDDTKVIEPRKKRFRIQKSAGGFTVTRGDVGTQPPTWLNIQAAYDVRRGNPLSKYHPADFKIGSGDVRISDQKGIRIAERGENNLSIEILDPDFSVTVEGFDEKRDVFVNVKMKEGTDDSQT
jgi:hypothetical protein